MLTTPRLARLARLLIQIRTMLIAVALLLLPDERLSPATVVLMVLYALLSLMLGRYWERFTPYLLRHPLLITADVFIAVSILAVDGPSGAFFIATVLTSTAAGVLFGPRGIAAVTAFQILGYTAALLSHTSLITAPGTGELLRFQFLVVHPLLYPVAGYSGWRLRQIFTELALEQERRRAAELAAAAAEERARLARDMHDSVAKTLRGAAMAAQALPLWMKKDPERAEAAAAQVVVAAETAAQEARNLIADLRDEAAGMPFTDAVETVLDTWSGQTGIATDLSVPRYPPSLLVTARHEALAVLREALTNIERHAWATLVTVELTVQHADHREGTSDPGYLVMHVTDDGRGFQAPIPHEHDAPSGPPGHYGLVGMVERARRACGDLTIESTPGKGTRLTLRVPLASATPTPERTVR
ncbi:sensor histidine kinase [Marinactinospora thermotolerans]|nr:histidine kinase [Marinactinospora thermotolerans]